MRNRTFTRILLGAVLVLVLMLPMQRADAATVIYVRKGVTGNIAYKGAPVPNAAWKVQNKSILKLKSSTSTKAVYTGKKVGKTILTCYNKRDPSQKMDITVYVMPSGKLNKMDFQMYGTVVTGDFGISNGVNFIDYATGTKGVARIMYQTKVKSSNTGNYYQTTRTAQILDSYSRIKMLYGNSSLKKFKKSERYYKYMVKQIGSPAKTFFSKHIKYYADYKYGKKYTIRFWFNKSKKVTMITYFKNYSKF